MIILLTGVIVVLAAVLGLLVLEVRRVLADLQYINTHDTNAELTTQTNWPLIVRLVAAINHSLVQNRALKEAHVRQEQQVRVMLTNLTHDIKTPLAVASGYVQLLEKRSPGDDHLRRITHNLAAVNYYLRYLMDFNLIQERSAALQLESVDLTALVESQLFDAYDQLNARHLSLTPALAPNVLLVSDRAMLMRVIQNLIGNWLKYASGQLRVTLSEPDPAHVQLVFANQTTEALGDVSTLVERFYTNDPARQDSTGLGLSIAASLMVQLNGKLSLSAEAGWFQVTLRFHRMGEAG